MKKLFFAAVCMVFFGISSTSLFAGGKTEKNTEGKVAVAATFDAMKELTAIVGKDKVYIHTIIPAGVEAHDFEPKAGDLKFLQQAKVVVSNGLGMEPWLDGALKAVKKDTVLAIRASEGITPLKGGCCHHHHHHEGDEHAHGEDCDCCGGDHDEHHHEEGHEHTAFDPHVWLSLESAKVMVKNIAVGLSKVDSANAAFYKDNASAFITEADALLAKYRALFEKVEHRHFVTGHAAFGYLCRDFNLEQNSVEDVFSAGEPSAQQLAKLADYCKQHGIKTVFSEEAASPEVSQALAKEVGASVEKIYTMESPEDGLSYMQRMTSNLEKIYKSFTK